MVLITLEKSAKLLFRAKNDVQVPSQFKNFRLKKKPSSLFVKIRSSKQYEEIFLKQMCLEILNSW